jgi:hypothetical protein
VGYSQGNCIVHRMVGSQVVQTVKESYCHNHTRTCQHIWKFRLKYLTLAMTKSLYDQSVVRSTSDFLKSVTRNVQEATTSTSVATNITDAAETFCSTINSPPDRLRGRSIASVDATERGKFQVD